MRRKLGSFAALLALVGVSFVHSGTAQAACWFGPTSQSTNTNTIVSSTVFGGRFVLFGQNQGTWSNGGFNLAWAQRYDPSTSVTTGVHGAAYTTQLTPNGTFVSVTTPFTNLQDGPILSVFPNSGNKIAALQVQVWFCQ